MQNRNIVIGLIIVALGGAVTIGLVAWLIIRAPGFEKLQARIDLELAASKLDRCIEEARKAGVPLTQADLGLYENTPESHELGEKIVKLSNRLKEKQGEETLLVSLARAVNGKDIQKSTTILRSIDSELDQVASALHKTRLPLDDLDFGYLRAFETSSATREVARALGYRCRTRATLGDIDGTLRDVRTLLVLKERLHEMQDHMSDVRALAAFSQAQNCLVHATYAFRDDLSALERISDLVEELKLTGDVSNFLNSELYLGVASMRNIYFLRKSEDLPMPIDKDPDAQSSLKRDGKPSELWSRANLATYLAMATELRKIQAEGGDPEENGRRMDEVSADWLGKAGREYSFIKFFWSPQFELTIQRQKQSVARKECTRAVLKVWKFRKANGRFPGTLAEAGFRSEDPFSGGPYRYKRDGEEIRVYSVNVDGKDDGGLTSRELRGEGGEDSETSDLAVGFPPIP